MSGALLVQANALSIPLRSGSVNLIVTSPPYFGQRRYAGGEAQIGAEPTPQEFLDALWAVTRECWRVLADDGVMFVNLGDKRAGSSSPGTTSGLGTKPQGDRAEMTGSYTKAHFGRRKSKQMLPHRYIIGCEDGMADPDGIGWVVSDYVWAKKGGMPESVTDRCRDAHEYVFQMTKSERWFSAVDEVREPHLMKPQRRNGSRPTDTTPRQGEPRQTWSTTMARDQPAVDGHPGGAIPSSVWSMTTEPLIVSDEVREAYGLPEHFAPYPQELPRRAILGWSPAAICVACGEGRRPVTVSVKGPAAVDGAGGWRGTTERRVAGEACGCNEPIATPTGTTGHAADPTASLGKGGLKRPRGDDEGTCLTSRWEQRHYAGQIKASPHRAEMQADLGGSFDHYTKPSRSSGRPLPAAVLDRWLARGWLTPAPPFDPPPTRPAVVLDPFAGTGTTVGVARALGRIGIGLDLSADYLRLARWRVERSGHFAKTVARTNRENQGSLL